MVKEKRKVLREAIAFYGKEHQILKAIEEMSELTKELAIALEETTKGRGVDNNLTNKIISELADVEITIEQIEMMFLCTQKKEQVKREKIDRLKKQIAKDKEIKFSAYK